MPTNISWVTNLDGTHGESWNPLVGCEKESAGCKLCYAKTVYERFNKGKFHHGIRLYENRWITPNKWKKPRAIFTGSMTDWFQPGMEKGHIHRMLNTVENNPKHQFLLLTKRPYRMSRLSWKRPFPENLATGVTVENNEVLEERLFQLELTRSEFKFISFEPLLEDVSQQLEKYFTDYEWLVNIPNWAIIGGESGQGCRPMNPQWVANLINILESHSIPVFFKQYGGFPDPRVTREFQGKTYNAIPYWD